MLSITKRKPKVGHFLDEKKEVETVESMLAPYENHEFIPSGIIPQLIMCIFPTATIVHTYSQHHHMIKVPICELLKAPIMNWQFNRPADRIRCDDIARYMVISRKPVDTMLYLSFNNKKRAFDVIDGIHRYTALQIVKDKTAHLDFISENEYGTDTTWLLNSFMILNLRFNSPEGELIELFKTLNKSNPIPELYVRDVAKDKQDLIQSVTIKWQNRFKVHFSGSAKPNKPNINRDRFIDVLDAVYDKYHLTDETKEKLEQILERNNKQISQNIPKKLSESIRQKCEATGCWLFLYSPEELAKML